MKRVFEVSGLFVIAIMIASVAFISLGELPIRLWDESRLAVSAYEMYKNGFSLIVTFEGKPDLWSTKPPLLIWLQSFFMHLIGPSEEAIRLPSAIASFVTAMSLIYFSKNIINSYWPGIFSAIILITSLGFIDYHGGRFGDYEALLTLWTTLASFTFYKACKNGFKNWKEIILFFLFLAFGTLTKSIAALMFAPAYLMFLIFDGRLRDFLSQKATYIGLGVYLILVLGYYFAREAAGSGYLEAVWMNDLFGRYANPLDDHKGPFTFYFEKLIEYQFSEYYLLSLAGLILAVFRKNDALRKLLLYSGLLSVIYLLVISSAQTKLPWYTHPVFPLASVLAGSLLYMLLELLASIKAITKQFKYPIAAVGISILLLSLGNQYFDMVKRYYKVKDEGDSAEFYALAGYLQKTRKHDEIPENHSVLYSDYSAHEFFYVNLMQDEGSDIKWKHITNLQPEEKVIVGSNWNYHLIQRDFNHELLEEKDGIRIVKIIESK